MHTVTIRIALHDGNDANDQVTHDGLTNAIETFESVASATVVEFSSGQGDPDANSGAPDETNA